MICVFLHQSQALTEPHCKETSLKQRSEKETVVPYITLSHDTSVVKDKLLRQFEISASEQISVGFEGGGKEKEERKAICNSGEETSLTYVHLKFVSWQYKQPLENHSSSCQALMTPCLL